MPNQVFALVNQKGGVGKTTTAYNLARAGVNRGKRVLVIDMDPQANLTAVTADVEPDQVSVADVLNRRSEMQLREVIVPGAWEGLDVVPSTGDPLGFIRDDLLNLGYGDDERRALVSTMLREKLEPVRENYDLILVDCAPTVDLLAINGIVASDAVLIVTKTRLLSANGLGSLLRTIDDARQKYHPELEIVGIVVNEHEANTIGAAHWLQEIEAAGQEMQIPVLEPVVPKRVAIADSLEAGLGLDEWPGAAELAAIYNTYLDHLGVK